MGCKTDTVAAIRCGTRRSRRKFWMWLAWLLFNALTTLIFFSDAAWRSAETAQLCASVVAFTVAANVRGAAAPVAGSWELLWWELPLELCVKMSPDLRVAYILWSSSPGMQRTVDKELRIHVVQLRSRLFSELSLRFSPKVVFMEDKPSKHIQELEEALAEIKERDSQA